MNEYCICGRKHIWRGLKGGVLTCVGSELPLTSVWMSCERCSRIFETNPNTSTFCSACIMSIMASITMKVPVLPTPALQRQTTCFELTFVKCLIRQQREKQTYEVLKVFPDRLSASRHTKPTFLSKYIHLHPGFKQTTSLLSSLVPAVDHDGPGEGGIHRLDLFEELEHADGREGNSEVRPAGEVELSDQTWGLRGVAGLLQTGTQSLDDPNTCRMTPSDSFHVQLGTAVRVARSGQCLELLKLDLL